MFFFLIITLVKTDRERLSWGIKTSLRPKCLDLTHLSHLFVSSILETSSQFAILECSFLLSNLLKATHKMGCIKFHMK